MKLWLLIALLLTPFGVSASNAGIVQGLWYDREVFFAGEPVRVYAAIRNNTGGDLSGTVEFFVNDTKIERNNVDALDGRIIESWADWSPDYGTSTIRASLTRTEISSTASGTQAVAVTSALAESVIFIDRDTDNDQIGNLIDPDDDNDGILDEDDDAPLTPTSVPAEEPTDASTDPDTTADTPTTPVNWSSDEARGLEQYLTESRAESTLSAVTRTITDTKKRLDAYRENRSQSDTSTEASSTTKTALSALASTSPDGFGAVTRSQDEPETQPSPSGSGDGWLTIIWNAIAAAFGGGYTLLLALLSFILSYPSLLQVALLILILYLILKTAKKFAGRPNQ